LSCGVATRNFPRESSESALEEMLAIRKILTISETRAKNLMEKYVDHFITRETERPEKRRDEKREAMNASPTIHLLMRAF
jgi:hypothetical protein